MLPHNSATTPALQAPFCCGSVPRPDSGMLNMRQHRGRPIPLAWPAPRPQCVRRQQRSSQLYRPLQQLHDAKHRLRWLRQRHPDLAPPGRRDLSGIRRIGQDNDRLLGNPSTTVPIDRDDRMVSVLYVDVSQGEPSLMCSTGPSKAQPIISGVESFQVLYGVSGVTPNTAPRGPHWPPASQTATCAPIKSWFPATQPPPMPTGAVCAACASGCFCEEHRLGSTARGANFLSTRARQGILDKHGRLRHVLCQRPGHDL
jgi:hypothetical protein